MLPSLLTLRRALLLQLEGGAVKALGRYPLVKFAPCHPAHSPFSLLLLLFRLLSVYGRSIPTPRCLKITKNSHPTYTDDFLSNGQKFIKNAKKI